MSANSSQVEVGVPPRIQLPAQAPGKATQDSLSAWAAAFNEEGSNAVTPWLWSGQTQITVAIWGVNHDGWYFCLQKMCMRMGFLLWMCVCVYVGSVAFKVNLKSLKFLIIRPPEAAK